MNGNPLQSRAVPLHQQFGFSYISALIFVAVIGITLTTGSKYWSTIIKRERETELFFRGDQIYKAIESYYKATPQGKTAQYPSSFKDLLKDPRYSAPRRHLRKLYEDPMSEDGQWGIIMASKGQLKGVFSKSEEKPLKSGNFPSIYEEFEKAQTYSDWKFVYTPEKQKNLPGQGSKQ
ncbi:MAG: type II secretion system protein [Deltaproteobacteria bacterium]|nr:type II secretion system protein [Deltaproteobacteria bacterium]